MPFMTPKPDATGNHNQPNPRSAVGCDISQRTSLFTVNSEAHNSPSNEDASTHYLPTRTHLLVVLLLLLIGLSNCLGDTCFLGVRTNPDDGKDTMATHGQDHADPAG